MLFADSEDPKIRKLLAEALAPTAFLEAWQHLLSMPTVPPRTEILWALRRGEGIPTAKAGPAGACQLEQRHLQVLRKSESPLPQTRSQGNGQHLLGRAQNPA